MTAAIHPEEISAKRLRDRLDGDDSFTLVDTREAESFEEWRIPGSRQFFYKPDHEFDADGFRRQLGVAPDDSIVTICAKGKASRFLADELAAAGYRDVQYVDGGMRAWSAVYDAIDVPTPGPATVVALRRRAKGCLGYLVADPETGDAAVIDATRHTAEFRAVAAERDWTICRVLDTHVHADHVSGGPELAAELGVPYHLGERASDRNVTHDYVPLERNEVVSVGAVDIKAVSTPGHTSEMVSYLIGREAICTGDTAFLDSVGRTELQFGDADAASGAEMLYDSLHGTVLAEPDDIVVLPGHFDVSTQDTDGGSSDRRVSTTVGELRRGTPVLQLDRAAFVDRIVGSAVEKPPNYERIIDINRGHSAPGDETEAIELELGPNRCAAE